MLKNQMNLLRNMNLKTKYRILKEIAIFQGLLDYIALATMGFFAGKEDYTISLVVLLLLGVNYYVNSKISYCVMEMLVKIQNEEVANGNIP